MHLEIRGQNIVLTPALLERVERRVQFAVGRFDGRVTRVSVRVADVNGPRGGIDKRCRIAVRVRPAGEIVVEDTHPDLYKSLRVAVRSRDRSAGSLEESPRTLPGSPQTS